MVAVENADVLRSCLGCRRCVDARFPRPVRRTAQQWIMPSLWSDNKEKWLVHITEVWRRFVIRSGARVSAAKQRNGRLCARPATPKGPSETLADEIPRVEVDIR